MDEDLERRRPVRYALLGILVALICVGAAELLVCRAMDPALYERVVSPVRYLYHSGRVQVKDLSEGYARWSAERTAYRQAEGARQRRQIEIRRLRRAMAEDQRELFALLDEMQFATSPLLRREGSAYAATECVLRDGQEWLTGGSVDVCYFCQGEEPWASALFGRDLVRTHGCGPTAMAMAVSSLGAGIVDPATMAAWAAGAGYAAPGSGSYLSIVQGASDRWGLECASLDPTAEAVGRALSEGSLVVALMGPGHFTARGHFILLRGATLTGEILVADPNSRENSMEAWDLDLILSELSASRHEGAPLWEISVPRTL